MRDLRARLPLRRFCRDRLALAGLTALAIMLLAAAFAPILGRGDPNSIDHMLMGTATLPTWQHPFGTDVEGRDYFTRALYGARVSLGIGIIAMLVSVGVGAMYGSVAAYYGGVIDAILMRSVDVILSFPPLLLILVVEALTNRFSLAIIVLVIGLLSWPGVSRIVRAEVLSIKKREYVQAATAIGAGDVRIIARHLIPNALAPVLVAATIAVGDNILSEASLSFLGLGVQIPASSWGNMLQTALQQQTQAAPWLIAIPGLLILTTVLAFNFVGQGIRKAADVQIAL